MLFSICAKSCQAFKKWTNFWNTAASINWKLYLCYEAVSYFRLFICVWSSSSSQLMFLLQPTMVNKICEDLSDMYLQCIWCQLATRISRNARCDHFRKFHNTMFLVSFFSYLPYWLVSLPPFWPLVWWEKNIESLNVPNSFHQRKVYKIKPLISLVWT